MSRKNYIATAKIMAWYRMTMPTDPWCAMVSDFERMFRRDNPNFDSDKFREACWKEPSIDND